MTALVIASLAAMVAVPQDVATLPARPVATPTSTAATATAVRVAQPPRLDGRSDDAVWQDAPKFTGFRQFEPRIDVDPTFQTEFQVAYDEKNLYVLVRMHRSTVLTASCTRSRDGTFAARRTRSSSSSTRTTTSGAASSSP